MYLNQITGLTAAHKPLSFRRCVPWLNWKGGMQWQIPVRDLRKH